MHENSTANFIPTVMNPRTRVHAEIDSITNLDGSPEGKRADAGITTYKPPSHLQYARLLACFQKNPPNAALIQAAADTTC